jgi:hypothetical protein
MLFLVQRIFGAGIRLDLLDAAHRQTMVVESQEEAVCHEPATGAAAAAFAGPALVAAL